MLPPPANALACRNRKRRGNNIIEFSLLLPWYIFLFMGAYDSGFFAYSLIATQNAARIDAVYCSASSTTCSSNTTACTYALGQLKNLPNIGTAVTTCNASPLTVTISYPGTPSTGCPDGNACVAASVAYVTPQLIPIPGLLPGQLTITRTVTMRLAS
jgi:Flp pilus assembly protein TadG